MTHLLFSPSKQSGFTLIELMIVVAIVAILAAIALPSYQDYLIRSRIPDATSNLGAKRARVETYYDNNRTYVGAPDCTADSTTSKYFDFDCNPAATANTYTLRAVGKSSMTGFTYTVNESNARATTVTGVSGWTGNTTCWVTNKGGSC